MARSYKVQVNYWISDKKHTKDEMLVNWLKKLSGKVDASYEKEEYRYSSWTQGTDYYSTLKVGRHNLFSELCESEGKYIIIEVNFSKVVR